MGKIVSQAEAIAIRKTCRRQGKVVVFTNGCFDIIHRGHIEYLVKAKKLGDILMVGLNSDNSVRKLKGIGRPVIKMPDRAIVLSRLDMVDYVTVFASLTPQKLIGRLLPDILVKGGDYKIADIVGVKEVKAAGGRVVTIPLARGRSSSKIISKIKSL
jgi:D-beta-D-heptose 7-phosphate kinase/D-beta-D-heptose 1-phosphate adenosyltransferase